MAAKCFYLSWNLFPGFGYGNPKCVTLMCHLKVTSQWTYESKVELGEEPLFCCFRRENDSKRPSYTKRKTKRSHSVKNLRNNSNLLHISSLEWTGVAELSCLLLAGAYPQITYRTLGENKFGRKKQQ